MGSSRLMMCLTHRPTPGLPLELPPASMTTVSLGELPKEAAVSLVCAVVERPELPPQLVETILSKARGNPLFLEEVARALRQSGILDRVLSTPLFRMAEELKALEIPDRLHGVVLARIDALAPVTKEALRTASVIGDSFDLPTLGSLLSLDAEDPRLQARLHELLQLELVQRETSGVRFKQALVQETAYETLTFARRRQLHHKVASYIEEAHAGQLEPQYEALAHHYGRCGDSSKTLYYSVRAGDKARQVFAHEEAIGYYHRALEHTGGPQLTQRSYVSERMGDCYEVSGRHAEATGAFSKALRAWRSVIRRPRASSPVLPDLFEGQPPKVREAVLCRKIGVSHERNSDYDSSLRWLEAGLRALPRRHPSEAAQLYAAKSVSLFRKGLYKEAIRQGRLGLALSRHSGERRQLAYAHNMLGGSYVETGDLRQALRHRQTAVRLYTEAGDLPGQASANNNLASCYQVLGDLDNALHHYEVSLKASDRLGNRVIAAVVHNNIGEVLLTESRLDEAVGHFQKVVETYDQVGDPLAAAGLALVNMSRAKQRQHDYTSATHHLERAVELLHKAGARGLLAEAVLQQAELELDTVQTESAFRTCARALQTTRELGAKLLEARALRILGRIALLGGHHAQAEAYLRESAELAHRQGGEYESGLALLSLAEVYGRHGDLKGAGQRRRLALRQATAIFRRLGAEGELSQAMQMQAGGSS